MIFVVIFIVFMVGKPVHLGPVGTSEIPAFSVLVFWRHIFWLARSTGMRPSITAFTVISATITITVAVVIVATTVIPTEIWIVAPIFRAAGAFEVSAVTIAAIGILAAVMGSVDSVEDCSWYL